MNKAFIYGTLNFSCMISAHTLNNNPETDEKTAAEEIEREDADGRYARIISWSSDFLGHGWKGTIAHTNSILGDGISTPTHDLFYICPRTMASSCFSLEIDTHKKITEDDKNKIIHLLSNVSFSL